MSTDGKKRPHGYTIGANCRKSLLSSAIKRGLTGKGWNENVAHAIRIMAGLLRAGEGSLQLNLVGHSRGSITILMLLNDLFFSPQAGGKGFSVNLGGRKFLKDPAGFFKKSHQSAPTGEGEAGWYEKQLQSIWSRRLGSDAAKGVLADLRELHENIQAVTGVNCFLFDPVGGPFGGDSDRQKALPEFAQLKRVRVLRMEHEGAALSGNMPTFGVGSEGGEFQFLTGKMSKNLLVVKSRERYVIPMPGSHGAGVSKNDGRTEDQRYIGTSYMLKLISECGTKFESGFVEQFCDAAEMLAGFDRLAAAFGKKLPGNKDRLAIHAANHTKNGYHDGMVNAHHRYLAENSKSRK
jgi:hypothetical protein